MFKKYKWNFVLVVLIVALVGFIIFDLFFYFNIKKFLVEQTFNEMRTKTHLALKLFENKSIYPINSKIDELYELTDQLRSIVGTRVTIIDANGIVLTDSDVSKDKVPAMDNHINRPEVQTAFAQGWGQSYRRSATLRRHLFYTAFSIKFEGKNVGYIRLSYYAKNFKALLTKVKKRIAGATLIGMVLLVVVAFLSGAVVTRPISRIVNTANKISNGDLSATFNVVRRDEVGHLASMLNEFTDRLKLQITQISDARAKLEHILSTLAIGVIVIDKEQNLLHANPHAFHILGLQETSIENLNIAKIARSEKLLKAINDTISNNSENNGDYIAYSEKAKSFIRYSVTPYHPTNTSPVGVLIQLYDVTELKILEAIRKDFVANASHELKTPLTSIIGYAETLLEGAIQDDQICVKFIRKIRDQGQRLEFLVADLLKLAELEREQPLELHPTHLNPILHDVIEDYKKKAKDKQISLTLDDVNEVKVNVDTEAIRTVLSNLIDNAIKYTPTRGNVEIILAETEDNFVNVSVKDTGLGIDPKYHDRIFQRFHRVDKARSRALGGTGLGLAIVKHLLERHETTIHVDSNLGQGSTFSFRLEKA